MSDDAMDEPRRTIVITGVSRGLGAALLERFVEASHAVAGCARSSGALETLAARHPGALLDTCDVADASAVESFASSVVERLGAPDLLINNA
ncbi:MAG: SDR family NAD(P)-dependent oxidoreductase, partial [Planctomycetota bacterium]|nr:SDR family NAD(P)-dependent oxidoreductase [Planctomycetota bacterium]